MVINKYKNGKFALAMLLPTFLLNYLIMGINKFQYPYKTLVQFNIPNNIYFRN